MGAIRRRSRRLRRRVVFLAIVAAAWYFLNPRTGRANQARLRDQLASRIRGAGTDARRLGQQAEGTSRGVAAKVGWSGRASSDGAVDDKTIADRVRSQVLGRRNGELLVDVAEGVVELRGPIDDPRDADALVDAILDVPGVVGVNNFTHRPGTPAPNKAAALRAEGDI